MNERRVRDDARHERHRETEAIRRKRMKSSFSRLRQLLQLSSRCEQVEVLEAAVKALEFKQRFKDAAEQYDASSASNASNSTNASVPVTQVTAAASVTSPTASSTNVSAEHAFQLDLDAILDGHVVHSTESSVSIPCRHAASNDISPQLPSSLVSALSSIIANVPGLATQYNESQTLTDSFTGANGVSDVPSLAALDFMLATPRISLESSYLPSHVPIFVQTVSTKILDCNQAFLMFLGLTSKDQVVGKTAIELDAHTSQELAAMVANAFSSNEVKAISCIDNVRTVYGFMWFFIQLTSISTTFGKSNTDVVHGIAHPMQMTQPNTKPQMLSYVKV